LSWQGKIYFCRRVYKLTGTACKEQTIGGHVYPWLGVALPLLLRLVELGCTICLWLANATLVIGVGVGSNLGAKRSSVNKNPELQTARMVTLFHRKDFSSQFPPLFIFCSFLQNHLTLSTLYFSCTQE
jgi:hypothetical protein